MGTLPNDGSTSEQTLPELDRSIFRLGRALRKIHIADGEHSSYATGAGYWELVMLKRRGPVRATEIASTLALDISTVSRQIKALESAGLVVKRPDANDARATLIELTPEGDRVTTTLMNRRGRMIASALANWTPKDRETFEALLGTFVEQLEVSVDE